VKPEQVWVVRHGETDWSAAGRHTGTTDLALNAQGRDAANRLGDLLAGERFALVLTSPLARARETCQLAGFGDSAEDEPDLREWDYGEYEGITTAEIRKTRPGWTAFGGGFPGGETLGELATRLDRVVERLREVEGRALVFGHGHALRVFGARWIDADPAVGANLVLATATISVVGWEREAPAILRWNST
jgi:probable phosphoglycerate mutase